MSSNTKGGKSAEELRAAAEALREEAFELGKTAHERRIAGEELTGMDVEARQMVARLDEIIAAGGREDAEVPSILGDAMLDLMFVLQKAEGPSSIRLGSAIS